jgi:hypothetical protein
MTPPAATPASPEKPLENFKDVYEKICTSYHSIDDFRTKLLGFLPLASGAGVIFITKDGGLLNKYVAFIGVFGVLITIGLFLYEIYGIEKYPSPGKTGS